MKYYRFLLILAVIIIIALFVYPRAAAHAEPSSIPVAFMEAPKASIRQMIVQYASYYGVDGNLALRIVQCESQFNPTAQNLHSTASGLFQWLDSSFVYYGKKYGLKGEKNNPETQIRLSMLVLRDGGVKNWEASRPCWMIVQ